MFTGKKRDGDGRMKRQKPLNPKKGDSGSGKPNRTEQRLRAQKEAIEAKLVAIERAKAPPTAQATRTAACEKPAEDTKNFGDQRVVIKFFYEMFGSPPEEDWSGRYGTIQRIRARFMDFPPKADCVYRTLKRLAEGDEDIASKPKSGGGMSKMSEDEDLLVGLLACRGFSQPMALQYLNLQRLECAERAGEDYDPVSLTTLRRAEIRVQLLRRKRRSQKAGSVDLDSTWAVASLAQSEQIQGQFQAGAKLQGEAAPQSPPPVAVNL